MTDLDKLANHFIVIIEMHHHPDTGIAGFNDLAGTQRLQACSHLALPQPIQQFLFLSRCQRQAAQIDDRIAASVQQRYQGMSNFMQ